MKKQIYLIFSIFLISVFCVNISIAGEKSKKEEKKAIRKARNKYLGLGLGFSYSKVIDKATSPLLYKGFGFPYVSLNYFVHSDKRIKSLEIDFAFNMLHTRTETPWYDPQIFSGNTAIRYNILYRIKKIYKNRINWYVGPEFNINNHFRVNYKYGNSAFNFDSYMGFGFATRFEFPFSYKSKKMKIWFMKFNRRDRNLRLSWQFSMPVINMIIRPSYVTITNFIDPDLQASVAGDQVSSGFFVPLNIRSQTELYYILHNQNMLKLSYVWNFFHHDTGYNKVQTAFHGFYFSFIFKFNNK